MTRRGTIGACKCKVGPCRRCGGACRRCKCRCEGYSVIDTLNRMRKKGVCDNNIKQKKSKKAKRFKASDMIVKEPIRSSKRQTSRRSWEHLNDDDSTYLPSVRTENYSVDTDTNSMIVVMRLLLDPEVLKEAIEELDKKLSSISLPTSNCRSNILLCFSANLGDFLSSGSDFYYLLGVYKNIE